MSIIMPSGKNKIDWSPVAKKEETLVKTASTEEVTAELSDDDKLFEAAKSVIEAKKKCSECDCNPCECKDDKEEVKEASFEGMVTDNLEENGLEEEGLVEVEVEDVEVGVEGVVETVEEAVEKVDAAVEDLKAVVEGDEAPVEDEVAEIEVEVIDEEPVSEEGEIIIESEPACCESCGATMAKVEKTIEKEASAGDTFVSYASISPNNRKKLRTYWKNMLNYVPDYVDLMTKDYE